MHIVRIIYSPYFCIYIRNSCDVQFSSNNKSFQLYVGDSLSSSFIDQEPPLGMRCQPSVSGHSMFTDCLLNKGRK